MALLVTNPVISDVVVRRTGNFTPSIWGDRFASFSVDLNVIKSYDEQIEMLKETVKKMLIASTRDTLENVRFIDLLCFLRVSYHFESEIEKQLAKAFENYTNLVDNVGLDLYTVANMFRLFRQHGHPIPSDVFEKFRDSDGKFKEALIGDTKGMLSLYEASRFGMHGEQILDDALAFTKPQLESLATQSDSPLAKRIMGSVLHPLHKTTPRLATRGFISCYEEDESKDETLLKFAKIDFNRLQLLYQEELCQLTRWFRNLDISANLVYTRDRIVEGYVLWGYGACFEPKLAKARIISAQSIGLLTILNDTYDAYGTIEELRTFTDAFQRMELRVPDELPEYMKCLYRAYLNMFDDWDQELANEGFSYNSSYARDGFKELVRAYLIEAEWCNKGYVPTVDEYISNGLTSSAYTPSAIACLLGFGEISAFEWINSLPKIHVAIQEICRLSNDIASHEEEQKRGHVASFIECYMKQYGVSQKEAVEACEKRLDDAWKRVNAFVKEDSIPPVVLMAMVNFARSTEIAYRYDDGYTNPKENLKILIHSLVLQPIPI